MEKSEPAFVPEWLRSTGTVTGSSSSAHHPVLSSLHSDAPPLGNHTKEKSLKGSSDHDSPRSVFYERPLSSNSYRSSISNGFNRRPYNSFNKNRRDKELDKEKEWFLPDHLDRDHSDPVVSILGGRVQKDVLRRSHSMVSGKKNDILSQRVVKDSKTIGSSSHIDSNGVTPTVSVNSIHKAAFEKDFPSLGTEEKHGVPGPGRVSSPGLSTAVQTLPVGNSSVIGGEGWTSALVEVPSVISSNGNDSSSGQQATGSLPVSAPPGAVNGLNMAEALAQTPSQAWAAPELSIQTKRLEELAIKQSRQLVPMTPLTSKVSVSDKLKPKTAARAAEIVATAKSGLLRGVRTDTSTPSHAGKFHVLKPGWENGVSTAPKGTPSLIHTTTNRIDTAPMAAASGPLRSPSESKPVERKTSPLGLSAGPGTERRPSSTQAQSRNDFFNLMRNKSSRNNPPAPAAAAFVKANEGGAQVTTHHSAGNSGEVNGDGGSFVEGDAGRLSNLSPNAAISEEEEARFLRSLGWEEPAGEDDGLTEDEINSFLEACGKLKPSLKLRQGVQLNALAVSDEGSRGSLQTKD